MTTAEHARIMHKIVSRLNQQLAELQRENLELRKENFILKALPKKLEMPS